MTEELHPILVLPLLLFCQFIKKGFLSRLIMIYALTCLQLLSTDNKSHTQLVPIPTFILTFVSRPIHFCVARQIGLH